MTGNLNNHSKNNKKELKIQSIFNKLILYSNVNEKRLVNENEGNKNYLN